MRKHVIVCGLALLATSCHMHEPQQVCARFVGTCNSAVVKSPMDDDSVIRRLDLLVFRASDGLLEARASGDGSSPLEATVSRDREIDWYIIANAPQQRLSKCSNEEVFLDNTIMMEDGFVMHCQGKTTLREDGTTITARLSRYICKVGVGSVTIDWADALPCRLDTIALMNVQGSSPVSGIPADLPVRYNCGTIDKGLGNRLAEMLTASPGVTIESVSPVNMDVSLWCMPNPSEGNSYGMPWQNRRTRIAVCINVRGQDNWYPIDLPPMEGNKYFYVDNIVIKGPGAIAPDIRPERVPASFTVRILDWEEEITPAQF